MKNRKAQYYLELATELVEPMVAREMFTAACRIEEISSKSEHLFQLASRAVAFSSVEFTESLSRLARQVTVRGEYDVYEGDSQEKQYWKSLTVNEVGWEIAEDFRHISRLINCYQNRISSICDLLRSEQGRLRRDEGNSGSVERQWLADVAVAIDEKELGECYCHGIPPLCDCCQAWHKKRHERERNRTQP